MNDVMAEGSDYFSLCKVRQAEDRTIMAGIGYL